MKEWVTWRSMFTTKRVNVWFKYRKHDEEMMIVTPKKEEWKKHDGVDINWIVVIKIITKTQKQKEEKTNEKD